MSWPGRIIMFSWYMAILVITATYTGNLVAFLAVVKEPPPFETLEELANQNQYKFGVLGNTILETVFKVSKPLYCRGYVVSFCHTKFFHF